MKIVFRSSLAFGLVATATLAWCGAAYSIRVRNNSPSEISLEVKPVGGGAACDGPGESTTFSVPPGETHDLVCNSSTGDSGFCLRGSASADWKRLDCIDRPLQDMIELNLFGR